MAVGSRRVERRGNERRCSGTGRTRTSAQTLYASGFVPEPGLAQAEQLHGKEMSFNNYVDADAARRTVYDFAEPCVAIVKHANPCGIAVGEDAGASAGRPTTPIRSLRTAVSSPSTPRCRRRWPRR